MHLQGMAPNNYNSDPRSKSIEGFIAALQIFAVYLKDGMQGKYMFNADHDCIYINVDSEAVSDAHAKALDALGWHVSSESDTWAYFT
jgi:hypothetical protein